MTFEKWLSEQKHRKDTIGELARSMGSPLGLKGIGKKLSEILELAYKEYRGSI